MSNPKKLEFGKTYHIYNRGVNGESIFREERNYYHFIDLYIKYVKPISETYAYCLLGNHFHFAVRIKKLEELIPNGNLSGLEDLTGLVRNEDLTRLSEDSLLNLPSKQFSNLFNAYTKAFNKAYERTGVLFERPFGREEVKHTKQLKNLIHYIHFNPQKHGFTEDFKEYRFSSYNDYILTKSKIITSSVLDGIQSIEEFKNYHLNEPDEKAIKELIIDDIL